MTYKTSQVAKLIGVHPNTIRFYEEIGLLPAIPRTQNGYRVFNDIHLEQLRLLRTAFRAEIVSSSLRQEAFEIVKIAAAGDFNEAYDRTNLYLNHLKSERANAEEAIGITLELLANPLGQEHDTELIGRKKAAELLGISIDVLRDWERNGLIHVPRNSKGFRQYGLKEINRLKIIRTLRNAHYSMMAILRMLNHLDNEEINLKEVIDTPGEDEDIVCAADRYITALSIAVNDALEMLEILRRLKKK